MLSSSLWARAIRPRLVSSALALAALLPATRAQAEKVLLKDGDWEIYTEGRVGAFVSYVNGDGPPKDKLGVDANGNSVTLHYVRGINWLSPTEEQLLNDPTAPATATDSGKVESWRVRTGFIGNQFGFGVRNQLNASLKATGFIQIWSFIESESRQKNRPNPADVRQGYAKLEGNWGSVIAGRTRCLFSRGATDINAMYAHRYGVGFPQQIDNNGPTAGMIGFGVLGSGFAGGVIYGTPKIAGLQLNAGLFEPIQLPSANWIRTKYLRPEGELTFEQAFGATGKVVLFANGSLQPVYKTGYCVPYSTSNAGPCSATAAGFGYGGRFELGFFRLGIAGHRGKGLGLTYALESTQASADDIGKLRISDGYYAQAMFVVGPVDLFTGAGIARVFLTGTDKTKVPDPRDAMAPQIYKYSVVKSQLGINGGAVYHLTQSFHFDLDYFRAQADWYLGEQQVVNAFNGGMTFTW